MVVMGSTVHANGPRGGGSHDARWGERLVRVCLVAGPSVRLAQTLSTDRPASTRKLVIGAKNLKKARPVTPRGNMGNHPSPC